ncbi:MAG: hypothetical protein A2499_16675 [Stygiobacter sp. RIFOXYC12_FULL_38_8]|nr:MAG: hypothetical protein A2X62_04960 [Stygiobacter sp. GWC2_38_9]OGU81252.1 MAG: hypothetical protein A2279_11625 [Stygiobacter sp. RIFOXYA12_FULL_38_9]OGV08587.1 MAG: hypothetical protein A2299_17090 [Stygiobacter sp. RIFOXYB2_FULL_37_11]OGV11814.1 MAG: hypothetical protein A2237_07150 [Stygiobacter sp. RIFOXYA2_FULL_38_8]OGV12526.1 MAG: hypothetical protein A2440_14845 [Stygiobacter sp. RIFOXYC2_FULL_38_25]OGV24155.1 MAG: hypothetical protein A2499_16675 [Stygiobacter sp. RIFOXYC12_FULL_
MKPYFFLIFLFSAVLITLSCKDSITNPEPQPGRRDYVWTVDTLANNSYSPSSRMWGNSPEDIYTISSGDWDYSISHFGGVKWSSYGIQGLFNIKSVYGFSSNNVFMGADNGSIWKFDGNNWKLFAKHTKDGHDGIVFDNLWGESASDFYALGAYPDQYGYNNSIIAHYNNDKWEMINTDALYGIVEHLYKNFPDNKIYIQVIGGRNFTDSTHIYEYSNGRFLKLYSNIWTQGLQADISLINNEVFFVLGNKISVRRDNKFQTVLNVDNPKFYQRIWGRSSKDVFLLMTDGLAHYNGSNIEHVFYFNKTPRTQIYGAALFEKDVFFLVYESQTGLSLVYHGKLNQQQ